MRPLRAAARAARAAMGFFNIELERNILLHPAHFGPRMREILYERLRAEARARAHACAVHVLARARRPHARRAAQVEGTCSGRYGFVVLVTNIKSIGEGVIQDTSAFAKFSVVYDCIVFRPFKGEVLDCVVTSVNKARPGGGAAAQRARCGARFAVRS